MGGPRDEVNRALAAAGATAGPSSWSEARASLFDGSTRRTAEAAGVTPRTVQRWLAAEEGRAVQSRPPGGCRRGQYRDGTRQTKSRGVVLG